MALLLQQVPQVARIEITPAQAEVQVGQTLQLAARALDASGNPVPSVRILWFGGGEGSVDSTGLVRAGFQGYITVAAMALASGKRVMEETRIRVTPAPPDRVEIAPGATKVVAGTRLTLTGTPYSANSDVRYDPVSFSSSNPRVVSITPDGRLQALAPGSATVTGSVGKVAGTLTLQVLAGPVRSLTITPGATSVRTGDVVRFGFTAKDPAGKPLTGVTARWSVAAMGNTGVAEIGDDGEFVAEEQGKYTVSVSVGSQSADAIVTATPRNIARAVEVVGRVPIKFRGAEVWVHPGGKCVYYSTIADRVYAIDVSDPSKPWIADSMKVDARIVNDVMTTEDGKYGVFSREGASNRKNGIMVFDASDACHPKPIADYTETVSGGVHSSFVYRGHVYLTDDATGSMRVISIEDPTKPREVARWQTSQTEFGRYVHDIMVTDGLAYLSYWNDGLIILDVGNGMKGGSPEKPVLVSQLKYDLNHLYRRVDQMYGLAARGTHTSWRAGKYVFIADEVYAAHAPKNLVNGNDLTWGRLQVVDVSNIEKPRIVAWYEPTDGGVHNVWVEGDTLYLGNYQGGGRAIDISGELKGDLLRQGREMAWLFTADSAGNKPRSTFTWGAVVKDGLVYYNDINTGLWITRLEPKQRPVP